MSPTPFIRISSHHHPSLSPSSSNRTAPTTSTATTPASVAAPTTTTTTAPSGPMAVPRTHDSVPPPLPPPSYIPEIAEGHDPGWQFANDPNRSDFARPVAVKPGSSLLGGATISNTNPLSSSSKNFWPEKDYHSEGSSPRSIVDARRGSSISTITVTRDHNMSDESLPPVDQDTSSSWGASDGRYVLLKALSPFALPFPYISVGAARHGMVAVSLDLPLLFKPSYTCMIELSD